VTALALYRIHVDASASDILAGTYHVTARGDTTWCDYARFVIGMALKKGATLKATPDRIKPIPTEAYPVAAARPRNSRLDCGKLQTTFDIHPPQWRYHVARLVEELTSSGAL
jgi:dTDP-4-dehydrorhamnose reductase